MSLTGTDEICVPNQPPTRQAPGLRAYRPSGFCRRQAIASNNGLNAELIIHGVSESLLASQVFLSRLNRYMAEKKLDLFQFASGVMTQPSA